MRGYFSPQSSTIPHLVSKTCSESKYVFGAHIDAATAVGAVGRGDDSPDSLCSTFQSGLDDLWFGQTVKHSMQSLQADLCAALTRTRLKAPMRP